MATALADVLEIVRAKLATSTGADVGLGAPVDSQPGLFIFPYNFREDGTIRRSRPERADAQTDLNWVVSCLLVPSPPDAFATIGHGLKGLTEQPVTVLGEGKISVSLSQLSVEALAQVFISAGIALRLAIPFELRWTSSA